METSEQPPGEPPDASVAGAWTDAGPLDALARGGARQVVIGEERVALFRLADGSVRALADRCPHAGAPLSAGALSGAEVVCAWHGWRFDARTGRCASVSWAEPVPTYPVRIEAGRVLVGRHPPAAPV